MDIIKSIREKYGIAFEGEPKENEIYYRALDMGELGWDIHQTKYDTNKFYTTEDLKNQNIFFKKIEADLVVKELNKKEG